MFESQIGSWVPTIEVDEDIPPISLDTLMAKYSKVNRIVTCVFNFVVAKVEIKEEEYDVDLLMSGLPFASAISDYPNVISTSMFDNVQSKVIRITGFVIPETKLVKLWMLSDEKEAAVRMQVKHCIGNEITGALTYQCV